MGRKKLFKILRVILCVALLLALGGIFIGGIVRCAHYNEVLADPLYVDAQVTGLRTEEDSEGDSIYVAYVSYTANGKFYENIRYDSDHDKSDLPQLGIRLQLRADPTDPGTLLERITAGSTTVGIGVILCLLLASFQRDLRRKRLSHSNRWVVETDAMERDLHIVIRARVGRVLLMLLTILFATFRLVFPRVCGKGYWIAAAVTAAFWLVGMINAAVSTWKVNNGRYEIKAEKLVRKEKTTDADGDPAYRLYYESPGRSWNTNVTRQKYLGATEGSTVYSVYLTGCRRPILHYDHQGDATG